MVKTRCFLHVYSLGAKSAGLPSRSASQRPPGSCKAGQAVPYFTISLAIPVIERLEPVISATFDEGAGIVKRFTQDERRIVGGSKVSPGSLI